MTWDKENSSNGDAITSLDEYRWKSVDFPLCQLGVGIDALAEYAGIDIAHWEEDGLGAARGFICQLPSGLVVMFQELKHAIEHLGVHGPGVIVEACDLVEHGVDALLAQLQTSFKLASSSITWRQTEEGVEAARAVWRFVSEKGE